MTKNSIKKEINKKNKTKVTRKNSKRGFEGILFIIGTVFIWQFISKWNILPNKALFPTPLETVKTLWISLPELGKGTWSSFLILMPGYISAVCLGIIGGILVGSNAFLSRLFLPFARMVAPVPPTIYIPYAIALLPTFYLSATFMVFIGAVWPVFLNSCAGAASLPQRYIDNSKILGLSRFDFLVRVVLPSSLPFIFNGMAIGLALSFILLTVAELFGASAGLGRFVQYYADYADYKRMVAGIIYTGFITLTSMELLELLKKKLLFWNK